MAIGLKHLRALARATALACCLSVAVPGHAASARDDEPDALKSATVLVIDEQTGEVLYGKNTGVVAPIASITKLMTAIVTLDANLPLDERVAITEDDIDSYKGTRSRLPVGTVLSRAEMLHLALMASENRAASSLGNSYPGGQAAFVAAMNAKAAALGMADTRFVEPTGLSSENVSSAPDLAKLVTAAKSYPLIREYSTSTSYDVDIRGRRVAFGNTNGLVRSGDWDIGVSKTGFIREAGRCLVMQARVATRSVIIVLLDSWGSFTRIADAARIRAWLEPGYSLPAPPPTARKASGKATVKQAAKTGKGNVKAAKSSTGRVQVQMKAPKPR
jgi:D-alanyl-D-alanine endopeptidase (penicillin-binding protein 7)